MTDSTEILVLGATGKTGRRVVQQLTSRGLVARAASRHPQPGGVRFDWYDTSTYDPALAGATAAYVVLPELDTSPERVAAPFFERARALGVRRAVLLSAMGVDAPVEPEPGLRRAERALEASGLAWTVLRPTWFQQNFSESFFLPSIQAEGAIATAAGRGRVAFVDADDIAAVAVEALTGEGHDGRTYTLTGPQALSFAEVAEVLSAAAGRPIQHVELTPEEQHAGLLAAGLPADYAGLLVALLGAVAAGQADLVSPDVERVTGRAPSDVRTYAERTADVWRAVPAGAAPAVG